VRLWDARFRASGLHSFAGHWFIFTEYILSGLADLVPLVGSVGAGNGSACQGRIGCQT
jgi:hypothetical protein